MYEGVVFPKQLLAVVFLVLTCACMALSENALPIGARNRITKTKACLPAQEFPVDSFCVPVGDSVRLASLS